MKAADSYNELYIGESYEFTFNFGCLAIEIPGIKEQSIPVIPKKMTMTDEQLQELIAEICNNTDFHDARRRRNFGRLLIELQRLPGLLKSSHPLYLEALDQTWEWIGKNICAFEHNPSLPISTTLVRWINGYLYWRIKDLYNLTNQYPCEFSLDVPINESSENYSTLLQQLSDNGFKTPTLSGIDNYIEKIKNQKIQEILKKLELYVNRDPEQIFQNCHPRNHANSNCQFLSQKLLFKEPPQKFTQISKELGINYQALVSHWKRKCMGLLQKKLEALGYSRDDE